MQPSNSDEHPTTIEDISSIQIGKKNANNFFQPFCKIWSLYTPTHPPQQFNINESLHKFIFLLTEAFKEDSFASFFNISGEDRQYYEVSLMIDELLQKLSKSEEDIAKTAFQVFENFSYDAESLIVALNMILHQHISTNLQKKQKKINLRVFNFPRTEMTDLKAHMVENFVSIEVVVIKVQQIKLQATSIDFHCAECKETFTHLLKDGIFSTPEKCRGKKKKQCKSKTFIAQKDKMQTIFVQRVKVQELDSDGRVPRQISCQLMQSYVGKVITGQTVTVSGIIKTESCQDKIQKFKGIFTPYMLVNSIKHKSTGEVVENDMKIIEEMKSDKRIFYSLIKSFCPTIYGHQLVKAGLLLGLVGGSSKNMNHEGSFRETSHVLLLGDPGIGKSQLLKYAADILPHSVYVSATSISNTGLTVTVNREGNDQSLQAGALILADNGICAIDEFDKASDSSSLLEVMQQQTISIAKAGIICQLKCRVGIVASANPIQGCYNKNKSFMENTKISNAILSRFDLIFLLMDKPDPERDKKLSEHIMKIHNKKRKKSKIGIPVSPYLDIQKVPDYLSLSEKLAKITQKHQTFYELEKMKKYLTFIKASIHPSLSQEAAHIIKSFYLTLRENNPSNSFQITNRQLESLVRLAMARARIQCREEVTGEDAFEVTQLMQESLFDSFEQMGYNINNLKNEMKRGKGNKKTGELSLPKQRNIFISTLTELQSERVGKIWEWSELVKVAKDLELNVGDFHAFIDRLNQEGVLLQKGNKRYSFEGTFL